MATPDTSASAGPADFLQAAWTNEIEHALYVNEELGVLVVPDQKPVVALGHVLVVAREAVDWDQLPNADILWATARVLRRRMIEEFHPSRGVGITIWGNQSGTPHIHVFPRNDKNDGSEFFNDARPRATEKQVRETQRRLLHPGTDGVRQTQESLADELQRRLGGAILGDNSTKQG